MLGDGSSTPSMALHRAAVPVAVSQAGPIAGANSGIMVEMRGTLGLALAVLAGCGKQLNPEYCLHHPNDEVCAVALKPDAPVTSPDAAPPMCPIEYTITIASQPRSHYRTVDAVNDWNSAVSNCANDGATSHLAVLSSATEAAELAAIIGETRFIGLIDRKIEGSFIAVTDELVDYPALYAKSVPPWKSGEPDNSGDCVSMTATATLELQDHDCVNVDLAYLCECDAYPNDPGNYN